MKPEKTHIKLFKYLILGILAIFLSAQKPVQGVELVKEWKKLIDIPDIRVSVKSLETVSKWIDDGIELTFEAIQDGAKIPAGRSLQLIAVKLRY